MKKVLNREWVWDRVTDDITDTFSTSGKNETRRKGIEFCAEEGQDVNNTDLKH